MRNACDVTEMASVFCFVFFWRRFRRRSVSGRHRSGNAGRFSPSLSLSLSVSSGPLYRVVYRVFPLRHGARPRTTGRPFHWGFSLSLSLSGAAPRSPLCAGHLRVDSHGLCASSFLNLVFGLWLALGPTTTTTTRASPETHTHTERERERERRRRNHGHRRHARRRDANVDATPQQRRHATPATAPGQPGGRGERRSTHRARNRRHAKDTHTHTHTHSPDSRLGLDGDEAAEVFGGDDATGQSDGGGFDGGRGESSLERLRDGN